jgi:hypothetical protein
VVAAAVGGMHRALEGADELLSKLRRYERPGPDKRPDRIRRPGGLEITPTRVNPPP